MAADVITECVLSKDNNTWRFRFEPVTLGHVRYHGCRDFPLYCISGRCHHSVTTNADWLRSHILVSGPSSGEADGLPFNPKMPSDS
jgi:hypothetical protein